jgi:glycosyltransferase involved in cell wall biosynthesis
MQDYPRINIVRYDDTEGIGSGEAFNRAIAMATADIVVLMCADDVFTDYHVVSDIVKCFESCLEIVHVSRWYYQFVDPNKTIPVRAWRGDNVIELANNPSGLAFRKYALQGKKLTNKMFVEAPQLVHDVIKEGWLYSILKYDTVAVRVHKSTARSKDYYAKMWTGSVVKEWAKLGWKTNDFTHLIQVANYYTKKAVIDEARNFILVRFSNVWNPAFWFFFMCALCIPRSILLKIPEIYRGTYGRWTTREIRRKA